MSAKLSHPLFLNEQRVPQTVISRLGLVKGPYIRRFMICGLPNLNGNINCKLLIPKLSYLKREARPRPATVSPLARPRSAI